MGYNIYKETDNLEYGFWLLSTGGTKYWSWSKDCWLPLDKEGKNMLSTKKT
jgi:hypothetical protein